MTVEGSNELLVSELVTEMKTVTTEIIVEDLTMPSDVVNLTEVRVRDD